MTPDRRNEIQKILLQTRKCLDSVFVDTLSVSQITTILEMSSELQEIAEELIGEME